MSITLVFLLLLTAAAAETLDFRDDNEALAADDDCQEGTASCSLNALQLSRQRTKAVPSRPGSGMVLQKRRRLRRRRETAGHIGDGRLQGAAFADYSVNVNIGSQTFQVIVDTGSSTFAVAATEGAGCWDYYTGPCSEQTVSAYYGSGNWTGCVCYGPQVTLAGLSAGSPLFAGIFHQENFLTECQGSTEGIISEGIVGMAYPGLISGFNGLPLFDSVVEVAGVPNVFSMQCCGWNGREAATGQLVLGGIDENLFTGQIEYTPVTQQPWFCVDLVGVYVDGHTAPVDQQDPCFERFPAVPCFLWPCGQSEAYCDDGLCNCRRKMHCFDANTSSCVRSQLRWWSNNQPQGQESCNAIVDSGTSELILETRYYRKVMHILQTLAKQLLGEEGGCVTAEMLSSFPEIVVQLRGDVSLSVPPRTYFQPRGDGSGCHVLFIGHTGGPPSILGQPLMEAYYTVFDKENNRVGFAPIAGCE